VLHSNIIRADCQFSYTGSDSFLLQLSWVRTSHHEENNQLDQIFGPSKPTFQEKSQVDTYLVEGSEVSRIVPS
jgi:hypothetical protein